jgi:SPP1 gp7 family putative phage head morphogenesis protein
LYEVQRGINVGWNVASVDENLLSKIISKPWAVDGKNFSERIWGSKSQLISSLHTNITQMCMLGQSPDKAIRNIEKSFGSSRYQASRLVMTESAYFGSIARKDALKELDVEEFEVVATLDSHTSDMCQDMDGQHFPMSDFVVGVTAPPFHPNCRTTTCPYFADDVGMRVARDDNGNRVYVPSNMTYKEWKGNFVGTVDDLQKVVSDGKIEGKKVSLLEKIKGIKEDITSNGGIMTENHIKSAGKAVQDELIASRAGFKKEYEDAKMAYENSDVKKRIDELDVKRKEAHKRYNDAPYRSEERTKFRDEWEEAKSEYWKVHSSDEATSLRNKISDAKKKYEKTWKENADELSAKLSEFREVGIGSHDLKKEHYSGRGTLRDVVTEAYSHYPAEWVEASIQKGKLTISKVSRGFYNGREIAISGDYLESQMDTAFHELGHRFEDVVKGIYDAEDVFYKRRTNGESLEWLGTGYAKSEKTRKDNFLDSYMGKEYPDDYYELVSMGFPMAYMNPTMLWTDEDYAQFIYGILALK